MHVDAAYAGAAMVCPEFRWAFTGIERADSLVVNAHKWMLTPQDCSLLWSRRPGDLRAAFSLTPEYLRTPDAEDALSDQRVRAGAGAPVPGAEAVGGAALLRALGAAAAHPPRGRARASSSMGRRRARLGALRAAPYFSRRLLPSRRLRRDNEALMHRVNATGEIFISHAVLDGRLVLRLAIGHPSTTEADIALAWELLRARRGGSRALHLDRAERARGLTRPVGVALIL